jgi:hypothetical protein
MKCSSALGPYPPERLLSCAYFARSLYLEPYPYVAPGNPISHHTVRYPLQLDIGSQRTLHRSGFLQDVALPDAESPGSDISKRCTCDTSEYVHQTRMRR